MVKLRKNCGFSLTEVLLAMGVLAVGMIFVAGVFPVGIHFTTIATERTIAVVVADEAFAKIRLYAIGDPAKNLPGNDDIDLGELEYDELKPDGDVDFNDIFPAIEDSNSNEFVYPSTGTDTTRKQYCWSALCRRADADPISRLVQVIVFVCRKTGPGLEYYRPDPIGGGEVAWPVPVKVEVKIINSIESDFQAILIAQQIPLDPDQHALWHSTQDTNISRYSELKIDKLLEDGRKISDFDKRQEIYQDFQRFLVEDSPAIFLQHPVTYTIERK